MKYEELCEQHPEVVEAMEALGRFTPTANAAERFVKGQAIAWEDSTTYSKYYNPDQLARIGNGLLRVAQWLDARAEVAVSSD